MQRDIMHNSDKFFEVSFLFIFDDYDLIGVVYSWVSVLFCDRQGDFEES